MRKKVMDDDDFDDDLDGEEEIEEIDLDARISGKSGVNWRRVELMREQQQLRRQLEDYNDYLE
ncbi:MAG: hypothetical protein V2J12_08275 [Gammaproteobacteria bacterium]|nr:hypothetical protein [Gammaproteobacteria bacterium]